MNPKAGKTVIKTEMIDIIQIFTDAGYAVEVYPTNRNPKITAKYVYDNAEKFDLVVCAGGDGTLDNTVSGIMKLERKLKRRIHMGYIPCGSTNDYARSLRISLNPLEAAHQIVNGSICHVDVGRIESNFFIYVAAFGAFTDVSYSTPQNLKNALGHAAYILEGVKALTTLKSYPMQFWFDGEIEEGDFIYGQVTNSLSIGGFRNFGSRHMSFSDGKFETVLIRRPKTPIELQRIVNGLLTDNLEDELIIFRKASRIIAKGKEDIPWTCDGEFGGSYKTARIANIRKAISLTLDDQTEYATRRSGESSKS